MKPHDIRQQLVVAFGLLITILIGIGYLGLSRMDQINSNLDAVLGRQWSTLQLSREALRYSTRNSRITMQIFFLKDKRVIDPLLTTRAENTRKISELVTRIELLCDSSEDRRLLAAVKDARTPYVASYLRALHLLVDEKKPEEARTIMAQETTPALFKYHDAWENFVQFQMDDMDRAAKESRAHYAKTRAVVLALIGFAVILAASIAVSVTREMIREISTRMKAETEVKELNADLERRVAERTQELRQAEGKYRAIFEDAVVGIFQITPAGRFLRANPAMARMHGYDSPGQLMAEVSDVARQLFADPGQFEELRQVLKEHNVAHNVELEVCRQDGSKKWLLANVRSVRGGNGTVLHYEGTVQDITERKNAEKQIQVMAYYDALTGLPNRTLLQDRMSVALASARRHREKVALLFLDLDQFKSINDSLGHSVGDLLLKEVAERLKKWSREQDTVARLAGDEFVLLLTGVKETADAAVAAQRIIDTMAIGFAVHDHPLNVTCSIGISIFPDDCTAAEALVKNADMAMYCAKQNGRNSFQFFTQDMSVGAMERLRLENSLRGALERAEFFLVYQPQINIVTGRITGTEALLRWRHPELGLVPPDKFIPFAEHSGLIISIGEWVLKTACAQAREWQNEGLPAVPVAVNVSSVQFRQRTFVDLIRTVLRETGLEPQYLELELTESLLISNADVMLSILQELKEMGVKLSIDDFGTGYSSLSYLRHFPVYKLKIDRSFVRDLTVDADDDAITDTIINMAKSLNLTVVAEGVESETQISFLRQHKCDEIQGYYFSKPLVAEEAAERMRQNLHLGSDLLAGPPVNNLRAAQAAQQSPRLDADLPLD